MSRRNIGLCVGLLLIVCAAPVLAQKPAVSGSASSTAVVPPLVSFGGVLTDLNGKPISGVVGVTFALYQDEHGGAPLWLETQNVYPDRTGHYAVLLGATTSTGLPADLFVAGEARWLGVQMQGQAEQPRVSLTSAPYALKAADAQTVGGLPASAFVLAAPPASGASSVASPGTTTPPLVTGTTPVTTAGGTVNKLAKFDAAADITSSQVFDNGTNVGIGNTAPASKLDVSGSETVRGLLSLPATGTATASGGKNSQPIKLTASAFSSGTATAVPQNFQWQAEPAGNNTATTSGTLNLLYARGANAPAETGLKISNKGLFTFATGQTFPGTGTITGITTATGGGLTGGGTSGTLNLGLVTSCTSGQLLKWNGTAWACSTPTSGTVTSVASGTGLTGGPITSSGTLSINTAVVPQLKANNSFTGKQSIIGSLGINTTTPAQTLDVSSGNAIVRGAANFKTTGNTAVLYIGDTNHPIEAIWNTGLAIGTWKAPLALFVQDQTGNVGIGTTTPTNGVLNTAANSKSVVGLFTVGWNATSGSSANGGDAIHAIGGGGDPADSSYGGGAGVVGQGGAASLTGGTGIIGNGGSGTFDGGGAGVGVVANGGSAYTGGGGLVASGGDGLADCCGAAGVVAAGGLPDGNGVEAIGSTSWGIDGGTGVYAAGGSGNPPGLGVLAHGGPDGGTGGGDGIDAFAGLGLGGDPNGLAGSFSGDVSISGNLSVSGTKSFRIDHPLDPANKYLYHAAVESSEVLNLYSGNVTLDANGEAEVNLPEWFDSLNRDFRYQLTAIGSAAPTLHIAQKIQNHSFKIAGGGAGLEISWQVTGVRQDAWEKAYPMAVEVMKPARERGYYINPELFGAPIERGIDWARYPQMMKRMKELQEKQALRRRPQLSQPMREIRQRRSVR